MDLENTLNSMLINNENRIMQKNVPAQRSLVAQNKKVFGSSSSIQNQLANHRVLGGANLKGGPSSLKEDLVFKQPIKGRGFADAKKDDALQLRSLANKEQLPDSSAADKKGASRIPRLSNLPKSSAFDDLAIKSESTVGEIPYNFPPFTLPDGVEDIDADDDDPQLVSDYVREIYTYMRHLERVMSIRPQHLDKQREMTFKMRSILIDWVINVQSSFKLMPETLYLSVSIMDRYFQKENVCKDKIQLVGVTACWIASKFEEIYPPDISDYVVICDKLYTKRDIIKCEMSILKALKFELCRPLPLHFLRRNSKAIKADNKIHALAKYLMESTLVDYETSHWDPSLLAAASLYLTTRLISPNRSWNKTMEFYSGYSESELKPKALIMAHVMKRAEKSRFQSCRKKYSTQKLLAVSLIPELSQSYLDCIIASLQ